MAERQLGVDPSNVADAVTKGWLQTFYTPNSYASFVGDGASTTVTVTHNLGSRNVLVQLYDAATYAQVSCDVSRPTINTVALLFATAPASNAYVAVVSGGSAVSAITSANITDATAGGLSVLTGSTVTSGVTMTEVFDKTTLAENTTLPASNEWQIQQAMEIGSTSLLEIPATSSLEVYTYSPPPSGAQQAYVATSESTGSTSYTDLTTTTDQVTVTIGASGMALVILSAFTDNNTSLQSSWVGYAVSGANTIAANDNSAFNYHQSSSSTGGYSQSLTALAAGSTTFKMKYKVGGNTGTFQYRRITVIPL